MKVKVISLPYIFQVLYVLCFTRPRYQVSVYRTIGPLVLLLSNACKRLHSKLNDEDPVQATPADSNLRSHCSPRPVDQKRDPNNKSNEQ